MDKDNREPVKQDRKLSAWYSLHQKSNPEDKVIMVVNNGNGLFEDCYGGCMKIGEVGYQFESVVERYPHLSRMPSTPSVRPPATLTSITHGEDATEALVSHVEATETQEMTLATGSWADPITEAPRPLSGQLAALAEPRSSPVADDVVVPTKKRGRGRPRKVSQKS